MVATGLNGAWYGGSHVTNDECGRRCTMRGRDLVQTSAGPNSEAPPPAVSGASARVAALSVGTDAVHSAAPSPVGGPVVDPDLPGEAPSTATVVDRVHDQAGGGFERPSTAMEPIRYLRIARRAVAPGRASVFGFRVEADFAVALNRCRRCRNRKRRGQSQSCDGDRRSDEMAHARAPGWAIQPRQDRKSCRRKPIATLEERISQRPPSSLLAEARIRGDAESV